MKDPRWKLIKLYSGAFSCNEYELICPLRELIEWLKYGQEDMRYKLSYEDVLHLFQNDKKTGLDYEKLFRDSMDKDITISCYDSWDCPCWENSFKLGEIEFIFNTRARPFELYDDYLKVDEDEE